MEDMIKKFTEIPTTCISDALHGTTNMDAIYPLKEDYRVAGRAFTVRIPKGQNIAVLQAIKQAGPGEVIVIDAGGDTSRAIAGDFILGMAKNLGINGVIADGVVRDVLGVKELDYPVFCKGTTQAAGSKKERGMVNVSITCGRINVNPGDIIVGDADGVVVVPQDQKEVVLKKSIEKLQKDEEREKKVSGDIGAINKYLDDMLSKSE